MKQRKVIVEFQTQTGAKRLDGIEVKFNVEKVASSIMNKASIDICNLTNDDIAYLTTYTSQFMSQNVRKRIRLFAGYDDKVSLIFDGDITEAMPDGTLDRWLKCKALTGYYNNKDNISITLYGDKTIQEICSEVASQLGLLLQYEATATKLISDFSFTGSKTKLIKELNDFGGIKVYEDDGLLIVLNANTPRKFLSVKYINEESGLIGMPKPDSIGCEMTILLDNSIRIGQVIYLTSKTNPTANGQYYIYEFAHTGDLRGNEFYTKIKARRYNQDTSTGILSSLTNVFRS